MLVGMRTWKILVGNRTCKMLVDMRTRNRLLRMRTWNMLVGRWMMETDSSHEGEETRIYSMLIGAKE